ncbi:serine/threonine-protein kinase [Phytohabitans houttuyneae]|uniref:serine/threonine-protein kinase n=1 Tax=Phytohabitans houttuyneae TaxID=1076126 RepID=UPI001564C2C4|nr:serine/threonine-protein kinase [Phytohabitans houttuyneae]
MIVLTEPSTIAAAAYPARPRFTTAHTGTASGRGQPVGAPVGSGQLPRHRDAPSADDPDRAELCVPPASVVADPDSTVDTRPLYQSDPVDVDGYRLVSRLGVGGMADVFYAVAPTGEPVAVKLLRNVDGVAEACLREFLLASAVDPDCTAPALGHGVSTAGAYLVTAHLPGYRSGATLVGGPPPAQRLWTLGGVLARTLAAIHDKGIVHCDVKPANLLVRDDDVRIIDFGIARYVGERCGVDGIVQYSRGWAAPEQLRTGPATRAVDVFAWGCLLAYLACGVHPFASRSEQEWILRVQSAQPDLFGLPAGLDELILRALARDPGDRPSAGELVSICRTRGV